MNSKKFLVFLFLVVLLFAFVKADDEESKDVEVKESNESEEKQVATNEEPGEGEDNEEPSKVDVPPEEEKEPTEEEPKPETKPEPKPESKPEPSKPKSTTTKPQKAKPTTLSKNTTSSNNGGNNKKEAPATNNKPVVSNTNKQAPVTNNKSNQSNAAPAKNAPVNNAPVNNAPVNNAAANKSTAPVAFKVTTSSVVAPTTNPNVPQTNPVAQGAATSNVSADGNVDKTEEKGGNGIIKGTVISVVAVGAVVGVATVGVRAYNKKSNDDSTARSADLGDIEAQPMKNDFGSPNYDNGDYMAPEDYNPYNIMNDAPNEPYITNNPYEYKPTYDENVIDTTPFNKVETTQDNFMSRESIFSTSGNIPQIGNDVFNFGDNTQLPYQEHQIENAYIEEPVANEIKIESYEAPNSQMPTLVPVQPEIVITQPEEEPAQEGYKQIVPNVAQMEIIETPDFNNMTTSMIEDHINNMELEQLANTETQQDEPDGGYKQIVPDIQEAVIENFEVEDDEEDPDMSVVDNITDTYRAALRATYCSTTDENRFSYRTVDSDHSLLHNMRENGEW